MAYINGQAVAIEANATVTKVDANVLQTTGDSETDVMSQKAVTNLLDLSATDDGEGNVTLFRGIPLKSSYDSSGNVIIS